MTTKEFVLKYQLDQNDRFNHSDFVQDLASDFIALLEINKANDNIKGFDNAVRCVRMKFDAINNKTVGQLPEKLWNFFWASVVVKLREELCPKDMERRRKIKEQRQKEYEQRKSQREWENEQFNDFFWNRSFFHFLFADKQQIKPVQSFIALGLTVEATEEHVKSAFKKLALLHHPDKGGKQENFITITEAKNKCLSWLSTKK